MAELSKRIRRATDDLRAIQAELSQNGGRIASQSAPSLEVVNELKAAVDHMRHVLWSYIEANSKPGQQDMTKKLQSVRMQRVTEMLKVLEPDVKQDSTSALPEAQTFFELIHTIAHAAVDRHEGRSSH